MKSESFGLFILKFLRVIEENVYLKDTAHNNKDLIKLGFSATVVLLCIFV